DQLQDGNLAKLAERAHRAYERRETKECLDLTRAMLLIDPENVDALRMRLSIQSDLQRDLESTRALFRQPHSIETSAPESRQEAFSSLPAPEVERKGADKGRPNFAVVSSAPEPRLPHGVRWLVAGAGAVLVVLIVVSFPKLRTLGASTTSGQVAVSN